MPSFASSRVAFVHRFSWVQTFDRFHRASSSARSVSIFQKKNNNNSVHYQINNMHYLQASYNKNAFIEKCGSEFPNLIKCPCIIWSEQCLYGNVLRFYKCGERRISVHPLMHGYGALLLNITPRARFGSIFGATKMGKHIFSTTLSLHLDSAFMDYTGFRSPLTPLQPTTKNEDCPKPEFC